MIAETQSLVGVSLRTPRSAAVLLFSLGHQQYNSNNAVLATESARPLTHERSIWNLDFSRNRLVSVISASNCRSSMMLVAKSQNHFAHVVDDSMNVIANFVTCCHKGNDKKHDVSWQ